MESAYGHPPNSPPRLGVLILSSTRVERHVHSSHERLTGPVLHLLDVPALGVLVHAQDIQGDDALKLNWHARVEGAAEGVVMVLAQRPRRVNGAVRDLFIVLHRLEGRLGEILRVLAPEELRVARGVVGVFWAWNQGQDGRDGQTDGRGGLEALLEDVDLVLQARDGPVHGDMIWWREDGEEWVYEDVVRVKSGVEC